MLMYCCEPPRLRDEEGKGGDPVAFSPICCLSALRDVLDRLGPLIHSPEEQARQRAALVAVDAVSICFY